MTASTFPAALTGDPTLVVLQSEINDMKADVAKHHKVLIEGNGEIPIVEKVRNHEAFITDMKYWLKFVVAAIIMQTITFASAAVIWLIKLSPALEEISKQTP